MEKENSLNEEQLHKPNECKQLEHHNLEPKMINGCEFDGTIQSHHRSVTLKVYERDVLVKGTVMSDRKKQPRLIRLLVEGLKWFRGRIFKKSE